MGRSVVTEDRAVYRYSALSCQVGMTGRPASPTLGWQRRECYGSPPPWDDPEDQRVSTTCAQDIRVSVGPRPKPAPASER